MMNFKRIILLLFLVCFAGSTAFAQRRVVVADGPVPVSAEVKKAVVDSVAALLLNNYVYPEKGKKMAEMLKKNLKKKKYDKINEAPDFASQLDEDIHAVVDDGHLGVRYDPEMAKMFDEAEKNDDDNDSLYFLEAKQSNFGFKKLEILQGNIGYLDLRGFNPAEYAGSTAQAAMSFLANTNAIIFDLRQNGGGSPSMIQLILSYLFEERTLFNNFYFRPDDTFIQWYTLPYINGQRMPDVDVYVLTSKYTFSAAEEFTYNLKYMERATIVGETTGGGAHPVNRFSAGHGFLASVSIGRAINPVTQTNWEGVGIKPHIEVPSDQALEVAHLDALKKLREKTESPDIAANLDWAIAGKEVAINPYIIEESDLNKYTGQYGPRNISIENGNLFYQRGENPKMMLKPMAEHTFMVPNLDYFRIKFDVNESGESVKIIGMYDNGRIDGHKRGAKPDNDN